MIGKTISHYKITEKLGEGGMGVVYLAEDIELDRKVALKFLPPHFTKDKDIHARFKREAKAAAALNHPNIITIHEIAEHDGQTFIVMEHVEGETLHESMSEKERSIEQAVEIAIAICEGLHAAHQKGIVHRDIKPENILIDKSNRVKIADFGLAKVLGGTKLTQESSTFGTLNYMSPEQIQSAKVDHRSDIFSFGAVLYEMITGHLPFQGEYEAAVSYSIMNEDPEPLARYKTGVSEGLQRIIDKALDKDRETRYQHVDELLSDLKREKKSSSEITTSTQVKKRKLKPAIVVTAALAIVAVLVAFIVINTVQKQTEKPTPPRHNQLTFSGNVHLSTETGPARDLSTISPDGQFIAYVVPKGGEKSIMVQDISGGQPLQVFYGKIDVGWYLRWSPDGSELMISCATEKTEGNFIIPRLGGNAQRITFYPYFCWSPDGSQIAGASQNSKSITFIDKTTGDSASAIELQGDFEWFWEIDWSPVGNRLAFLTFDEKETVIWTIKTDGSQQQKVVEHDGLLFSPRWSADGEAIYFLRSHSGGKDLMKIGISYSDGTAKSAPVILQTGLQAYGFTLSKDNRKILYTRVLRYSNLWLVTLENQRETTSIQTNQLTTGTSEVVTPRISPDGRKVAFTYRGNICIMPIAGGQIEQLTFFDSDCVSPCWSPDGEELAFANQNKVWRVRTNGGKPRPFSDTEVSSDLAWAPGSHILYQRLGNRNFHLLDPKTEAERPLLANDSLGWVFQPRYSPDGKNVAVHWNRADEADTGLWLISLEDSSQTLSCKGDLWPLEWPRDGNWIYVSNFVETPTKIFKILASGGEPKTVATLPFEGKIAFYELAMTNDGRSVVCAVSESVSDVWLMENFDPEVK